MKRELIIKTMPEEMQVCTGWNGAYNLVTGEIEIGSSEIYTPVVLWHEIMHKILFENYSLEAGVMWDRIAKKIEHHLFGKIDDLPFVFTLPPKRVKTEMPKHRTLKEKGLAKEE